jgi:hypothetical protein
MIGQQRLAAAVLRVADYFNSIRKPVAESRSTHKNTLGAQIRQVGCMLDNALRRQQHALLQRQRLRGAFGQHRRRFFDLNEVGLH